MSWGSGDATIVVHRPAHAFAVFRGYRIVINGSEAGRVRHDRSVQFPVDSAVVTRVQIKLDWSGSNEWQGVAAAGETIHLVVRSHQLIRGFFSSDRTLRIDQEAGPPSMG